MSHNERTTNTTDDLLADDTVLRSHDLAELAGTTPRALRHYHKIGLLPEVSRDPNGYRRYSARDLVRVLRIRQLAMSGMPLRKIGGVLEEDAQSQDELLAALDRDLKDQAAQIKAQRKLLAELRTATTQPAWFSRTARPTATQQLDHDVWTLITATGGIDADTAATMQNVLGDEALAERAAAWYPEFERLETHAHIDDERADRLAGQIASFADTVLETTGLTPTNEELPIMALVEQMQADTLSPAQQKVWSRFVSIIEQRWKTPSNSNSNEPSPE